MGFFSFLSVNKGTLTLEGKRAKWREGDDDDDGDEKEQRGGRGLGFKATTLRVRGYS